MTLAAELDMRPLVAHCHLGLGSLYRRTGDPGQAQEHLTTARAMYGEMVMTRWLALGYKLADRHHGKTGLRDIRENDVADELNSGG